MPIKAENRHRYPADWPAVREQILQRAGHKCEHAECTARHYASGRWHQSGAGLWRWQEATAPAETWSQARVHAAEQHFAAYGDGPGEPRFIVIVLTVAHLNHEPADCRPENLAALCQRHHLAHDQAHHRTSAYTTRMRQRGNLELPL